MVGFSVRPTMQGLLRMDRSVGRPRDEEKKLATPWLFPKGLQFYQHIPTFATNLPGTWYEVSLLRCGLGRTSAMENIFWVRRVCLSACLSVCPFVGLSVCLTVWSTSFSTWAQSMTTSSIVPGCALCGDNLQLLFPLTRSCLAVFGRPGPPRRVRVVLRQLRE